MDIIEFDQNIEIDPNSINILFVGFAMSLLCYIASRIAGAEPRPTSPPPPEYDEALPPYSVV